MMFFSRPEHHSAIFSPLSPHAMHYASEEEIYFRALAQEHERRAQAARERVQQEALRRAAVSRRQQAMRPFYAAAYRALYATEELAPSDALGPHPLFESQPRQRRPLSFSFPPAPIEAPDVFFRPRAPSTEQVHRHAQEERVRAAPEARKACLREASRRRETEAQNGLHEQFLKALFGAQGSEVAQEEPKGVKTIPVSAPAFVLGGSPFAPGAWRRHEPNPEPEAQNDLHKQILKALFGIEDEEGNAQYVSPKADTTSASKPVSTSIPSSRTQSQLEEQETYEQILRALFGIGDEDVVHKQGQNPAAPTSISIPIHTPESRPAHQPSAQPQPQPQSQDQVRPQPPFAPAPGPTLSPELKPTDPAVEAAASTIQSHWRAHHIRTSSLTALDRLESQFAALRASFTFPAELDFPHDAPEPTLLYSPNNIGVLTYEHQLTALLTKLDEVESGGERGVREARKALVKQVEAELEELDRKKVELWEAQRKPADELSKPAQADAEAVVVPEVVAPAVDEASPSISMEGSLERIVAPEDPLQSSSSAEETIPAVIDAAHSADVDVVSPEQASSSDVTPVHTPETAAAQDVHTDAAPIARAAGPAPETESHYPASQPTAAILPTAVQPEDTSSASTIISSGAQAESHPDLIQFPAVPALELDSPVPSVSSVESDDDFDVVSDNDQIQLPTADQSETVVQSDDGAGEEAPPKDVSERTDSKGERDTEFVILL